MNIKVIFLILATIYAISASSIILGNQDTCFFLPLGHINTVDTFNYTITQAWTAEQVPLLKSGSLNTSDFIDVKGWAPYSTPIKFFTEVAKQGEKIIRKLTPIKDVLHGSDAPQFSLSDADLQFAFGSPSQAKLYKVPSGQALIAIRFQAAVAGTPFIGKWSVLIDLIQDNSIEKDLSTLSNKIGRQISNCNLTPQDVTTALNIIPPFIQNSLFWTFTTLPTQGNIAPVDYQAYLLVLRGGEEFLAGPINDGQPQVIQVKDVVKDRSMCS